MIKDNEAYLINNIKYINKSANKDPKYNVEGDSGFDLRAWINKDTPDSLFDSEKKEWYIVLDSLERALVHTGLYFDLPNKCELQVRARSGCSLKLGLGVLNSPATIDSNYTGEVGVISVNLSKEPIRIYSGDRIAQAVICPVYNTYFVKLEKIDTIDKITERGEHGFGYSGMK